MNKVNHLTNTALIVYTTAYGKGSDRFKKVAETIFKKIKGDSDNEVICIGIYGKQNLLELFHKLTIQDKQIVEFHFIGHAEIYGPMYGTMEYPEQYSKHELKNLKIPFANAAKAYFHCSRSARWFAPFFSEQFKVETFGYHWHTIFSACKTKYKTVRKDSISVYLIGCIGKKTNGLFSTLKKQLGSKDLETMQGFKPKGQIPDSGYNKVAGLYGKAFQDIKVRKDEWKWLRKHLPKKENLHLVDIGCGNGALLKELAKGIKTGVGFDTSISIIEQARKLNEDSKNISFKQIDSPNLPVEDKSIDLIISLLSFRYLDWDPLMDEIKRILKPDGRVLIIDMVAVPFRWHEFPMLIKNKLSHYIQRFTNPVFYKNISQLAADPEWKIMLKNNPIRAEHEMKRYLESRFPGRKVEKINMGWNSCILAFDSGSINDVLDVKPA